MLTDVLNWNELQAIIAAYDIVFLMAYLPASKPSDNARKVYEELSRKVQNARFLQFDSTTKAGLGIVGKLTIKFAPMTFAFRGGEQVTSYVGDGRAKIENVIKSIATVERWEDLEKPQLEREELQPEPLNPAIVWTDLVETSH